MFFFSLLRIVFILLKPFQNGSGSECIEMDLNIEVRIKWARERKIFKQKCSTEKKIANSISIVCYRLDARHDDTS